MAGSIPHGYRIRTDSLSELTSVIERFRAEAEQLARTLLARRLAARAVEIIDDAAAKGGSAERPLSAAWDEVEAAYRNSKATGQRAVFDDFECEANLVFHEGAVYVLLHAEMREYHDLFLAMPGVEEYRGALYNGVPSFGLSQAEWDARQATWKAVLKGNRLGPLGLQFELLGRYLPRVTVEEVLGAMPSLDARLSRVAKNATWSTWLKAQGVELDVRRNGIRLWMEFSDWCGTPEGKAAIKEAAASLRPLLDARLTAAALKGRQGGEPAAHRTMPSEGVSP